MASLGTNSAHLFYVCELGGGLDREANRRRGQVRDGELRADGRLPRGEHICKWNGERGQTERERERERGQRRRKHARQVGSKKRSNDKLHKADRGVESESEREMESGRERERETMKTRVGKKRV